MRKKAQCIKWFISTKAVYRSTTGTGTIKGSGQLLYFLENLCPMIDTSKEIIRPKLRN